MPDITSRERARARVRLKKHFEPRTSGLSAYDNSTRAALSVRRQFVAPPVRRLDVAEIALVFRDAHMRPREKPLGRRQRRLESEKYSWDFYEPLRATSSPRHTSSAINATVYRARAEAALPRPRS